MISVIGDTLYIITISEYSYVDYFKILKIIHEKKIKTIITNKTLNYNNKTLNSNMVKIIQLNKNLQ